MLTVAPKNDETGPLGFAIADALLDLLVEKGVLTKRDADVMLLSVARKFTTGSKPVHLRCANTIIAGMPLDRPSSAPSASRVSPHSPTA